MNRDRTPSDAVLEAFAQHRPPLFSIAYRMLGSVADAEDIMQEAYLRWLRAAEHDMRSPKAYLSTVVTRLCLDRLRSVRVRRESYIGPWLPEPLLAGPASETGEDSLSMAFLVLLESLTPSERAVFLLREVFSYDYAEVASLVGKSEANCRQLARRAKQSVKACRPRFESTSEQEERLLAVASRAGVSHLVYISIVGIDRAQSYPYYRVKLETELAVEGSPVPRTILRATQSYDLVLMAVRALARLPVVPVPKGLIGQPIDAGEVAGRMVELALDEPAGRVPDIGGPEIRTVEDTARSYLGAIGSRKKALAFPLPGETARDAERGADVSGKQVWRGPLGGVLARSGRATRGIRTMW